MKRTPLICTAAIAALLFVAGCEADPNSSGAGPDIRPMAAAQADAHPAIAYGTTVTTKGKTYRAVAVMDSDGTDQAAIYTATSTAHVIAPGPTWSPGGGTVAFFQYSTDGSLSYTITLRDVSVSRGKAVGSNTRTLINPSDFVRSLSWSSLSSTDKIAFTTQLQGSPGTGKVQVVSASGGTPTVLYQTTDGNGLHFYYSVTWSPDDSKIAFVDRAHATGEDTIRVINASTGALLEVIPLGTTNWTWIDWSNSGANLLAMSLNDKLYYVTPTTGSTPWTNNVTGYFPTWSPDNSAVVTTSSNGLSGAQKTVYAGTTTSTLGGSCWSPDWKK